jgi:quercetin dioxygenase-like cupin family protein/DNA-binding XRE family transcriptional regulator
MPTRLKQQAVGEQVRLLRTQRGLSLRSLATQTGFSPSFISQLENGQVSPSISSMEKIASTLGVSLVDFFAAASEADGGLVVRAGDRHALTSGWSKAAIEAVSPLAAPARLEVISITLEPGGRSGKHPYAHPREEFALVLKGRVTLTLGPEEHELRAGDAACVLPGELRLWRNDSRAAAQVLIVTSPIAGPRGRAGQAPRRAGPTRTSRR